MENLKINVHTQCIGHRLALKTTKTESLNGVLVVMKHYHKYVTGSQGVNNRIKSIVIIYTTIYNL